MQSCEMGPLLYRPYPKRLESLTICRCNYKGNTFYSVILRPWVLVRAGFEFMTSHTVVWYSTNWAYQPYDANSSFFGFIYSWASKGTYESSELDSQISQSANGTQEFCWTEKAAHDQTCLPSKGRPAWPEKALSSVKLTDPFCKMADMVQCSPFSSVQQVKDFLKLIEHLWTPLVLSA